MKRRIRPLLMIALAMLVGCKWEKAGSDRGGRDDRQGKVEVKSPVASGGINDGNTGELATTKSNPWFIGETPAHYCVQFGEDTVAAKDESAQRAIVEQVEAAFAQWVDFLQFIKPVTPGSTFTPSGEFLAGPAVANLTRSFQRVDCASDPEMRIKLGTWEKVDTDFLRYTSRYTVAYALRTAYSDETGRSRGFIWLVADSGPRRYKGPAPEGAFWAEGRYVQNVVLHELGHVFGVDHLPATFMDARFPAGALASRLATGWTLEDFRSISGGARERCGLLLHPKDEPESPVSKDIFGVEPATARELCWRDAEDRRRPEDHATPILVWLKGDGGKTLAEQLLFSDGLFGEVKSISGNYLKKVDDSDYRYSTVDQAHYATLDLHRLRFDRGALSHWVEIEIVPPGIAVLRFAYDGPWKQLPAWLIAQDRYRALNDALEAASFENDGDPDD